MAVRIRKDGRILCAEMYDEKPGDTYLDDETHYHLSVIKKVLVTECWHKHKSNGEWYWRNNVPDNIEIDEFYK